MYATAVVNEEWLSIRQTPWPPGLGLLLRAIIVLVGTSLVPVTASAARFRELIVFGDSLSDTGNVLRSTDVPTLDPVPVSPPYFMGRFSNGPVWVERLAETLGLALQPSLDGGTNFAFGGAEIGSETEDLFERDIGVLIPSLQQQVEAFLAADFFGVEKVDPAALYVLWGGPNDLRDALHTPTDPLAEALTAVDELAGAIAELADVGAVYFLVPNVPDLGKTPESLALGAAAQATAASTAFNNALTSTLDALEAEHNIVIFRLDTFAWLDEVLADPAAFGFTNVTDACLDGDPFTGGSVCANPAAHLFWDELHPTAAGHTLLATLAAAALPPLIIIRGDESPEAVDVTVPDQDLPVLQVRLGTGPEAVRLTQVTLNFAEQSGPATLVQTLRVRLINDANANGTLDTGETVLATQTHAGIAATLALDLTTPLEIPANATAHLVTILDINAPGGALAQHAFVFPLAWLAGLLPGLGLVIWPGLRRRRAVGLGIVILCVSLALTSCDTFKEDNNADDQETLGFTVGIPTQGMTVEGTTSGPLTVPAVPITGASVRLRQ